MIVSLEAHRNCEIIKVDVHSEKGACMTFEVSLDDKVRKINKHIRSKTKVPVQDQVLLLGFQTLKSEKKLLSCDLDKETSIHLTLKVVKPSDQVLPLILVESSDEGQRHLLRVPRANSVAQVKKMIEDVTGITPEKQIVTCNGKKLEDGKIMRITTSQRAVCSSWPDIALGDDYSGDGVISGAKSLFPFGSYLQTTSFDDLPKLMRMI